MSLKEYQKSAIMDLLVKSKKLLAYSSQKKMVFEAPTGSGKTIMMAQFLIELVKNNDTGFPLSFIWTAPRQLHIQSKEKLENYFEKTRALKCSFFEDLDDRKISEDEVLFFNWESINKEDNIYIRDNENDFNLSKVLDNTREEGRKIVLVIDESHYSADAPAANKLKLLINADLTIEVSATPILEHPDDLVPVQIEEVKAEGMIKNSVVLNPGFKNILEKGKISTELKKGTDDFVISEALKKRNEILASYSAEGSDVNPLVLIQLPDRKTDLEEEIKNRIIQILKEKYKISSDNSKLAIHLSENHENLVNIAKNDSEVQVLIFKQALALGWDCPRAHILVLFREWHSPIFKIQTIGRIMRMPEPDRGHYKSEVLNHAYVYTNLSDIQIEGDMARNIITIFKSERIKTYKPVSLYCCHSKRHRETTRLAPLFIKCFQDAAKNQKLSEKIDCKLMKKKEELLSDWRTENINTESAGIVKDGGKAKFGISSFDLQKYFEFFIRQELSPFYPETRSVSRVKESIYKFFLLAFKMSYDEVQDEIIQIVLHEENKKWVHNVIDEAKQLYLNEVSKIEKELEFMEGWEVPEIIRFNENYIQDDKKMSVLQPFYTDGRWKSEKAFIEFIDAEDKIEWWFKNGDRDLTFFAVPYSNGEPKPFYVDFIIKMKDGRIGLFDTKSGFTKETAGPKVDGLFEYIKHQNSSGKKLFGGIVTNTDSTNYRGRWVFFDKPCSELKNNDLSNWKNFEL